MSKSVRDQMMESGLVKPEIKPAARRAEPVEEKGLPPPFEAPARGVIVGSRERPTNARVCEECGVSLPPSSLAGADHRCAECKLE